MSQAIAAVGQIHLAGEFQKLGQRGYCTSHLVFENSEAWLVGEPNKGLSYMFQMMNEARIATGRMGAGIASAAYYSSLDFSFGFYFHNPFWGQEGFENDPEPYGSILS